MLSNFSLCSQFYFFCTHACDKTCFSVKRSVYPNKQCSSLKNIFRLFVISTLYNSHHGAPPATSSHFKMSHLKPTLQSSGYNGLSAVIRTQQLVTAQSTKLCDLHLQGEEREKEWRVCCSLLRSCMPKDGSSFPRLIVFTMNNSI